MAIERSQISSQPIEESTNSIIEIRTTEPSTLDYIDPPETPGKLIGFYNAAEGVVNLYVVNDSGTRLLLL